MGGYSSTTAVVCLHAWLTASSKSKCGLSTVHDILALKLPDWKLSNLVSSLEPTFRASIRANSLDNEKVASSKSDSAVWMTGYYLIKQLEISLLIEAAP